jgi:hypothetical protein
MQLSQYFQEKVSILMEGLKFVHAYIDDLLMLSKGSFKDHLLKLNWFYNASRRQD